MRNEEHLVAKQPNGQLSLSRPKGFAKANTSKINNCIANSMFLFFEIKTSTKGKRNFHISDVKLIWLIRKKTLKAILRLFKLYRKISRVKNIEFSL